MFNKYLVNFRYTFQIKKPLLILRLVRAYLSVLVLGRRPLRYMDFAIGFACNLKCEHCSATALKNDFRRKITLIVKQTMKLGAINFSFQGGESTFNPELLELIKNTYPKRNVILLNTIIYTWLLRIKSLWRNTVGLSMTKITMSDYSLIYKAR